MLSSIQIKNFALIESLALDFHSGMTVITGETGAGKSIVIDALGLALGERADTSVVRFGTDKADVTASFHIADDSPALNWLKAQELDEGHECILRRVVAKEGRSKCFINGSAVTLNMLRELGDLLVDIHGQHAHQSLLKPHYQLQLLDELLENIEPLHQVSNTAKEYRKVCRQLDELLTDSTQRRERAELLAYQLNELEALSLTPESIETLENDHARASSLQELTESTQRALVDLFDDESAAYQQLAHYQQVFQALARKDTQLQSVSDLLATAAANLEEVKAELRHYTDSLDIDPEQLKELDERLSTLFDLARKHHVDMQQLPEVEQSIRTELEQLTGAETDTEALEQKKQTLATQYQEQAAKLTKLRQATAKKLAKDVTEQMQSLGMEGGGFDIQLQPSKDPFSSSGAEQAQFIVSANPGQPMQELNKVASGGELSRISLAIQVITAQKRVTPCLIFDEVDVGIGGQTADIIGRMLSNIAKHAQVICVTHQPQVAARGDHHLQAAKTRSKNATETAISKLERKVRVEEIARMVGGQAITESTLKHAEELLAG